MPKLTRNYLFSVLILTALGTLAGCQPPTAGELGHRAERLDPESGPLPALVISEVLANPLDEARGEFVELVNLGSEPVEAAGLVLSDGDALDVLAGYSGGPSLIPAGGVAVVIDPDWADLAQLPTGAILLTAAESSTLGNGLSTSDPIHLLDATGSQVIDSYNFPTNPGNGISMERRDLWAADLASNWAPSACGASPGVVGCPEVEPEPEPEPVPAGLVISEVMSNPLDEARGEYIELTNLGAEPQDLAGLVLSDGDAFDWIEGFEGGPTVLSPGARALILDRDYAGAYAIGPNTLLVTVGNGALGNGLSTNDPIRLLAADGQSLIDSFSYPFDAGNGVSIEKRSLAGGDTADNWQASTCALDQGAANAGASPGSFNCVPLDGEHDEDLRLALWTQVANHTGLDYTSARQAMFSQIDNRAGQVECVYTGFNLATDTIPDANVMNTEHTWAKSWGANTYPASSDLHHLFPTTNLSNAKRANYPFRTVVSTTWSQGGSRLGYASNGQQAFEPREGHKGDVARALFYFSVRYRYPIEDGMEAELKAWNQQDPPDAQENARNDAIATHQHNRNPFVDHPEYAERIADF